MTSVGGALNDWVYEETREWGPGLTLKRIRQACCGAVKHEICSCAPRCCPSHDMRPVLASKLRKDWFGAIVRSEVDMGLVFLLVGAPAVGKSSAAKALARRCPKSVHIPVDSLRDMVVSGRVLPGEDWSAELIEQLRLARKTASQMAMDYSQAGFDVVIDDFWDPVSRLAEYDGLREMPDAYRVLLYPSQAAAEARNVQRSGADPAGEYIATGIRLVYHSLQAEVDRLRGDGWRVLDTTDASIDETVDRLLDLAGRAA